MPPPTETVNIIEPLNQPALGRAQDVLRKTHRAHSVQPRAAPRRESAALVGSEPTAGRASVQGDVQPAVVHALARSTVYLVSNLVALCAATRGARPPRATLAQLFVYIPAPRVECFRAGIALDTYTIDYRVDT